MVSVNHKDKIQFIRDGLSKESLDDMSLTLETQSNGSVHRVIHHLYIEFQKESQQYSIGNLTLKDSVCQFIRKLDGKHISDP